jgi:hypothetical protein
MFMSSANPLPSQPEVGPAAVDNSAPSMWLYLLLTAVSTALIVWGFLLQPAPDWAGLLLNIGAGLIGSIVILVVVDRRLRAHEVEALGRLPAAGGRQVKALVFPSHRAAFRYAQAVVRTLEPVLQRAVYLPQFEDLERKARSGFVLRGVAGGGKTMWTQIYSAESARRYLAGEINGRVVVTLPLARWIPDRGLHRALYEKFSTFSACSEWAFNRLLKSGLVVVVLDGYDELWNRQLPLQSEHQRLKAEYPEIAWVITMRPEYPAPDGFGEVVDLSRPGEDLVAQIVERYFATSSAG